MSILISSVSFMQAHTRRYSSVIASWEVQFCLFCVWEVCKGFFQPTRTQTWMENSCSEKFYQKPSHQYQSDKRDFPLTRWKTFQTQFIRKIWYTRQSSLWPFHYNDEKRISKRVISLLTNISQSSQAHAKFCTHGESNKKPRTCGDTQAEALEDFPILEKTFFINFSGVVLIILL